MLLHSKIYVHVLKRSLSAHLMQVKLLLVNFYLNGGLHAVSIGKASGRFGFLQTKSKLNFGFPHIQFPTGNLSNSLQGICSTVIWTH